MKTLRFAIAVAFAIAVGVNYGARYLPIAATARPAVTQAAAFPLIGDMAARAAEGNLFYSPNQGAMQIGAGVCVNATNLDGGQGACLYTITVDSSGDLPYYCNSAAGASCKFALQGQLSVAGPAFFCDGGLCPTADGGY